MGPLSSYIDEWAKLRDCEESTRLYYHRCIRQFERATGHLVLRDITLEIVNNWLHSLTKRDLSTAYRSGLRQAIAAIWPFACELEHLPAPNTKKIVRVKRKRKPVRAWSRAEVSRLRMAAASLDGFFSVTRNRQATLPRGPYMATMIDAAWYTGLAQIDLRRLQRSEIVNGKVSTMRSKTNAQVIVQLPPQAMADLDEYLLARTWPDDTLWPLWGSAEIFRRTFAKLAKSVGLRGSFKILRASAATAMEIDQPGTGHVFIGDTRDVFLRYYWDARQLPAQLPTVPELGG